MYVRNYGEEVDLPWQNVFQTKDKSVVEQFCWEQNIKFFWQGDRLKTYQVCQAIAVHPRTGEMVWFNQAHLFHISSLDKITRDFLLAEYSEGGLPRNVYYGDGSSIEDSVLDEVRHCYKQETILFPWKEGDILMLDNMLMAHGRTPFTGERRVVVGMAEPYSSVPSNDYRN
ncbi:TauD/TfdA family dioxygenase [Paenibacillus larvae]|uniref:TauD/TfdA family dioxygenase n=1 Tax=Paenibacillus larvae TaxID=1464 RepID=UPI0018DDE999|nr:TauD/TfdA family dioxygenase [Paenibacillus larvae]